MTELRWNDYFDNDREAGIPPAVVVDSPGDPVDEAVEQLDDVTYEIVEQPNDLCDVVAYCGKARVGVLARTKHRGIAEVLVRALFAEGEGAEHDDSN